VATVAQYDHARHLDCSELLRPATGLVGGKITAGLDLNT
jgi:hypothetical protein